MGPNQQKKNKSKRIKIDFKDPLFTHIGKGAPLHRWKYPRDRRCCQLSVVSCQDRPRYRPGYRAGYQYCMVYRGTLYNNGDLEKTSSA